MLAGKARRRGSCGGKRWGSERRDMRGSEGREVVKMKGNKEKESSENKGRGNSSSYKKRWGMRGRKLGKLRGGE